MILSVTCSSVLNGDNECGLSQPRVSLNPTLTTAGDEGKHAMISMKPSESAKLIGRLPGMKMAEIEHPVPNPFSVWP